jgi:hypothetical protein
MVVIEALEGPWHQGSLGGAGSFSQGFGIGVWLCGSGYVLRCWRAGAPTLAIRAGWQHETNHANDCSGCGRFAANTYSAIAAISQFRGHVSSDTVLYCTRKVDCLFVAHMIHVRTPAGGPAAGFGMVPDSAFTKEKPYRQY